ncbi:hypothetical protein QAD02_007420 [Eretmocerus hayati]|uniref:Uncharacterized protein n=1 Tax=Eretmocerus hayati TaxID=131215 RepID=A0ACC2N486_9HYME|nr:hypothetical protein QAD02_007420 [Eretmocerus hayati]
MELNGRLPHYSANKFERRHTTVKHIARNTCSCINLPYTIGIAYQLQTCYLREMYSGCKIDIDWGSIKLADGSKKVCAMFDLHGVSIVTSEHKNVIINNVEVTDGTVLFNGHDCNGEPKFVKVRKIYRADDEVIFHGSDLRFINFNKRYHAYEVVDKSEPDTVLKYLDNAELLTCVYVTIDKRWYVATKYDV